MSSREEPTIIEDYNDFTDRVELHAAGERYSHLEVAQRYKDHVKAKCIISAFLRGEERAVAEELVKTSGWRIASRGGLFKASTEVLRFDPSSEGFRVASPKDAALITRLINGAYENFPEGRVSPRWVERDMFQAGWFNIILEEKGEAKAFGCLILEAKIGEINWISVLPRFQGRGLGKKVMSILLTEASKHKSEKVKLCHVSQTPWAVDFYTRFNFRPEGKEIAFVAYEASGPSGFQKIRTYLDAWGRLKVWPKKHHDEVMIWLAVSFELNKEYSETEVNRLLDRLHTFGDSALLRRELYNRGFFNRRSDGSSYQRVK